MIKNRVVFLLFAFTLFLKADSLESNLSQNEIEKIEKTDISLEEIIKKAITYHPKIKVSKESINVAQADIESAKWGYYPTPSVDVSNSSNGILTVARVDQPLWTGGKLDSQYDLVSGKKEVSKIVLQEDIYLLTSEIIDTVKMYELSKKNILTLEDTKKQMDELSSLIDRRIEAGASTYADRDLLNSRMMQLESDFTNNKIKQELYLEQIELLSGIKTKNIQFDTLNNLEIPSNTICVEMLKQTHPILKKMFEEEKVALLEVEKVKSQIYPNLSLRAEHKQGALYEDDDKTKDSLIYLTLQASTGAGLVAKTNIEAAKIKAKQLIHTRLAKEKELINNLLLDYNNWTQANKQTRIYEQTIESSQKVLESNIRLFAVGKKQWLDLVNSIKELSQYKLGFVDAQIQSFILKYKIALQIGKLDTITGEINDI